jgi:hypothetical protein
MGGVSVGNKDGAAVKRWKHIFHLQICIVLPPKKLHSALSSQLSEIIEAQHHNGARRYLPS